ncbi:MAG: outer membrane protein transport protein [Saprospiraceae bacterium]
MGGDLFPPIFFELPPNNPRYLNIRFEAILNYLSMHKKLSFLLAMLLFSCFTQAQTVEDALRYSSFEPSGTARFMATGGALGPLGADLSVTGTNPAGIALYRTSEFTITPALFNASTNAQLTAVQDISKDGRTNLNFHNIGVVMTSQPIARKWKSLNMAITLNNVGNFNRQLSYQGRTTGSISQRWQELANDPNVGLNNFEAGIAFDAGAIYDIDDNPDDYEIDYEGFEDQLLDKSQTVINRGGISELSFAFGANYNERVMIGLSIGLPILNFEYDSQYSETDEKSPSGGNVPYLESLEYNDKYTTTGGGINAKLGVIVRASQALRIGGAVHTPTAYNLEDEFETELINNYFADPDESGDFVGGEAESTGLFEYRMQTPWRFFGGAGLILGKNGFISGEVELVDYNSNTFKFDGFDDGELAVNGDIAQRLTSVVNLRLGGEFVYDDFRFRLGFGTFPSAFVADDTRRNSLSAGAGYRRNRIFLDLAYRYTSYDEFFFPYFTDTAVLQEVQTEYSLNRLLFTFGVKF